MGGHIGSENISSWWTFQGHETKVKVTASEKLMIWAIYVLVCLVPDTGPNGYLLQLLFFLINLIFFINSVDNRPKIDHARFKWIVNRYFHFTNCLQPTQYQCVTVFNFSFLRSDLVPDKQLSFMWGALCIIFQLSVSLDILSHFHRKSYILTHVQNTANLPWESYVVVKEQLICPERHIVVKQTHFHSIHGQNSWFIMIWFSISSFYSWNYMIPFCQIFLLYIWPFD